VCGSLYVYFNVKCLYSVYCFLVTILFMDFKPIKKKYFWFLISHWKLACSCQEIAEKLLSCIGVTQQSFTSSFKRKWETTLAKMLCNWEITEFSQIYCIFVLNSVSVCIWMYISEILTYTATWRWQR